MKLESTQAGRYIKTYFRIIFLGVEKKIFQNRLATEAAELAWKARHIKIPKPDPENWYVEYFLTPENKFSWYYLIEAGRPLHVGYSITMRSKSVVRESCRYKKSGYKRFVKTMKRHLFGNSATRMTAERCEEFFDDRDNFRSGI